MRDLIIDLLRLIVTTIYLKFRKVAETNVRYTNNRYLYTLKLGMHQGKQRILHFDSKQVGHTQYFSNRFVRNRTEYTYEVILTEYIGGELVFKEQRTFPQPCPKFFNGTIYPHLCSINSYMDIYKHWERA